MTVKLENLPVRTMNHSEFLKRRFSWTSEPLVIKNVVTSVLKKQLIMITSLVQVSFNSYDCTVFSFYYVMSFY